jgi:arylsulfatase A-like enzyme
MRQRSLLANTIIAFVADHGAHLGDQGLLQKQTFYDQVATVPYFFHAPNHIARRKRIDTLVEVLGLVPTLLDLAGLPSHSADSPSLASTLKSGKEPPPRRIQSQIAFGYQRWRDDDPQIMIRDGQWKLHCFHDPANPQRFAASRDAALYDLRSDPHDTIPNTNTTSSACSNSIERLLR